jgi:hypothetical protein
MAAIANLYELVDGDYATQAIPFAIAAAFFYWVYFRFFVVPDPNPIPRVGKSPGFCGLGVAEAKRNFHANGSEIINKGYRKVGRTQTTAHITKRMLIRKPYSTRTVPFEYKH